MLFSAQIRIVLLCSLLPAWAVAAPIAAPGETQHRSDLLLFSDSGVINIPISAWPIAFGDVSLALSETDVQSPGVPVRAAYDRVKQRLRFELNTSTMHVQASASGSFNPRTIRSFENTPREEGEARAALSWLGERFTVNLAATYAANPFDDEKVRPDGSYVGAALGNWIVTAGWQERWWGPWQGRQPDLVDKRETNARSRSATNQQSALQEQVAKLDGSLDIHDVYVFDG